MKEPCVYILASEKYGTLYIDIGVGMGAQERRGTGFHEAVGRTHAGLVRATRNDGISHLSREGAESVEARLEIEFDRGDELRSGAICILMSFELAQDEELDSSLRWNDEHEGSIA